MRFSVMKVSFFLQLTFASSFVFSLQSRLNHNDKTLVRPTSAQSSIQLSAWSSSIGKEETEMKKKALDKQILTLALPTVLNFAILPLVGAVDTFWVGRMENALALAGQGAANQIFSSAFWIISFLPSVVTPLIAKAAGSGDTEAMKDRVGEVCYIFKLDFQFHPFKDYK